MSKLLFDEQPLVIDRELARILGLNEAIVIQQIHYWTKINEQAEAKRDRKNGISHFHDGRYWTFNTLKEWQENNFEFWSVDTVKRTFAKLEKEGILLTGNYNKDPRDRTKWYAIDYEKLESIVESHKCKSAKCTNGATSTKVQNAQMQIAPMEECKMHRPLPEITTETTTSELIDCNAHTRDIEPNQEIWEALEEHGKSAMIQDTVSLADIPETLTEIHTMLEKHFPRQLDPEVVRISCQLFTERSYDWKNFRMKMDIANPVGFFRSCYVDAIKQYKLSLSKGIQSDFKGDSRRSTDEMVVK